MKKIKDYIDKIIIGICVILFVFMLIMGSYQIISRYVLKAPSTISEELVTYSFTWMSMFAASYVFGKREHMNMVFFVERFSKKIQKYLAILSETIIFFFAVGVLLVGGKSIALLTLTQTSPALGISMGYIYSVLPICGVIISIYNIFNIIDLIKKEEV